MLLVISVYILRYNSVSIGKMSQNGNMQKELRFTSKLYQPLTAVLLLQISRNMVFEVLCKVYQGSDLFNIARTIVMPGPYKSWNILPTLLPDFNLYMDQILISFAKWSANWDNPSPANVDYSSANWLALFANCWSPTHVIFMPFLIYSSHPVY